MNQLKSYSYPNKILIISPVRNEEKYIEKTISSILNQTLLPAEWVIIDDGSSDGTWELISSLTGKYSWITVIKKPDRGERSVGPGVIEAFYYGLKYAKIKDYDFVCKMDGDLEFKPTYFESLLEYFKNDPYLGAASGKPYLQIKGKLIPERTHDEMVTGQLHLHIRECFEAIGGLVREVHWEAIAVHRARMAGFRTRSIDSPELKYIHLRIMGSSHKGIIYGRLRWGKGQYFLGTGLLYLIFISLYRSFERPYLIGGIPIIIGYVQAAFSGMIRYSFPGFKKSLRAWQYERLKIGRRIENIPES